VNPDPRNVHIKDFEYELPPERISQYPLDRRDESKLLVYKDGSTEQTIFRCISEYLPSESLMIFNDTKVIQARLLFRKHSGARIEVLCLGPHEPVVEMHSAFQQSSPVVWKCLIGNSGKWKAGILSFIFNYLGIQCVLYAEQLSPESNPSLIRFVWEPNGLAFSEVLEACGKTPLPPYIKRESIDSDRLRYQTIYAREKGSVAAPTAGLHFTETVLKSLNDKGIEKVFITLHVGAGTFRPVNTPTLGDHVMHSECVSVPVELISAISQKLQEHLIAVGTTTVRTLESLYLFGVKLITHPDKNQYWITGQWDPYSKMFPKAITAKESLQAVLNYCKENRINNLTGITQLMIAPGYHFKIPGIMVTNFHQPGSTLLLLIAAFIGKDWQKVYDYALKNDFRFLSYGDSCLLYMNKP
jgi:S-adenosylmethionine:tRNA ribosyltransferase-isomerase